MQADLRSWLGLATGAGVALIAIAVGNIGQLIYLMDVHPGVAGWVQAVGAILAIWAGFFQAARAATRAETREAAARDQARQEVLYAALTVAVSAAEQFHQGIEWLSRLPPERSELKAVHSQIDVQLMALRSVAVAASVNIDFIQAFTSLGGTLDYAANQMQAFLTRPTSKDYVERRHWDALIDQLVSLDQIASAKVGRMTELSV